jgi:hypothetical protein
MDGNYNHGNYSYDGYYYCYVATISWGPKGNYCDRRIPDKDAEDLHTLTLHFQ